MDRTLRIELLGAGTLSRGDLELRTRSTKTLALLAYLAVEHARPHARSKLAALLWPANAAAAARHSLRQSLHALRALGDGALAGRLAIEGELVRFVPGPGVVVDVHCFEDDVASASVERWRAAADAYRGPLLDGRNVDDCPGFAEWLSSARERLHSIAVHNLDRLATDASARGEHDAVLRHAGRMRALGQTDEVASRHLMRAHAAHQDSGALETEWGRLVDALRTELGAEPSAASVALRRALSDSIVGARSAPAPGARVGSDREATSTAGIRRSPSAAEALLRASRAAERVHAFGPALDLVERALSAMRDAGPQAAALRCDAMLRKEGLLDRLGRRAEQLEAIDALLALADAADDPARRAAALLRRANACAYVGEHGRAHDAAQEALRIFRALGDPPGEAEAMRELGFAAWRAGRVAEALDHGRDALAMHRAIGDVAGEASALHNLAELHRELGSTRRALEMYEQALALHWSAGRAVGEILTRFGSAHARLGLGDAAGARREYEAALALARRVGERTMESRALQALAARSMADGDSAEALVTLRQAIDVDRAINYAHALGHDLVQLAWIHLRRHERAEARAALQEALVWFEYVADAPASSAVLAACAELDAGRDPAAGGLPGERVPSHLPLAEGKVYCTFESPLARVA